MNLAEHWIDSAEALAAWVPAISAAHELALDTESNSMFAYRERLCLVQLHLVDETRDDGPLLALDPLGLGAPSLDVLEAFFRSDRRVLMHGGEYDVAIMKRELGLGPRRLFDTQAAASLLGFARTGYVNLVHELLGVELGKEHQQFDWGRRPVPSGARRYAFDDVRYLPELTRVLESMAHDADLSDEVEVACEAVCDSAPHAPLPEAERFWRVAKKVKPRGDAVARLYSLFLWREQEAEARDVPPARLVPNVVLGELAARPPASADALSGLGLSRRLVAEAADALIQAATRPPVEPPARPKTERPDPRVQRRESALKDWREREAGRRGVTLVAVLPARALDALARGVPLSEAPQLGARRLERYGPELQAIVART